MTSLWYLESKTCLTVCDTIIAFSFTFYEYVFLLIYIIVNTHIPAHNSHSYLGSAKQHIICYAVQYGYLNYLRKCIVHLFKKKLIIPFWYTLRPFTHIFFYNYMLCIDEVLEQSCVSIQKTLNRDYMMY